MWCHMLPLIAVESTHILPTNRVVFGDARIMHVMEGAVEVQTAEGAHLLASGNALAIGAERWSRINPRSRARLWTVYANERFLRAQMALLLPDRKRVRPGVHPKDWDGAPLLLMPGISRLQLLAPLWRQMSILRDGSDVPEVATARTVELFARWVGLVAPTLLAPTFQGKPRSPSGATAPPIRGRLTDATMLGHVGRAVRLLSTRMHEQWTVAALADSVRVSRSHLTRLFVAHTGTSPTRFLTEIRLTEFTRLIEETELSLADAALRVGWVDPRVASAWFRRRFGLPPSQYRLNPHPHLSAREGCDHCDASFGGGRPASELVM